MAIESSTFGVSAIIQKLENYDSRLQTIILNTHFHMFTLANSWLYRLFLKNYFYRRHKSWSQVSIMLDKFLENPRLYYSPLMKVLDEEINKFPNHTCYNRQLRALSQYIAMGPKLKEKA